VELGGGRGHRELGEVGALQQVHDYRLAQVGRRPGDAGPEVRIDMGSKL
jgi:hypothetical protein